MHNIRKITDELYYIGCSDRRLALFESAYPVPEGMSYNSYLLKDEKTVLFDTVDKACAEQFYENLSAALDGRKLDYIVVHHMEPDHAALLQNVLNKYPEAKIVCSTHAQKMIKQFFDFDIETCSVIVKEGDTLNVGFRTLQFVAAPMVHWPEVMLTYLKEDKILFSADAFGSFGSINGTLSDNNKWEHEHLAEARRYYANIVGKYGLQVQMLLKKAANLEINMICPLHGLIIKENIPLFIEKYSKWASYKPEESGVLIAYSSVYGGTENTVEILASKLADRGITVKMHDLSYTHYSKVLADAFKYSHIVLASTTYNAGVFESMASFIRIMAEHNLQNRKFVIIENGSWAPACGGQMRTAVEGIKCSEILNCALCVKSTLKKEQLADLDNVVNTIEKSLNL